LLDTVLASDGIPHTPATGKTRAPFATSAGPPAGPLGFRVSKTRHGLTVKKRVGADDTGGAVTVTNHVVWFEPPVFVAVSLTV